MKEKKIVAQFFEMISKGTDLYIFGLKETMYALSSGVVECLLLWNELPYVRVSLSLKSDPLIKEVRYLKENESIDNELYEIEDEKPLLDWILENYKDFGSRIELVSNNSSEGNQFVLGFGGIGAILRYPIQMPEEFEVNNQDEKDNSDECSYEW